MPVANLDNQLCFALYSASSHLTGVYRALLEPLDITYTQFIVLMALWQKDHVSITELAEATALSKSTMTPLLKRMEHKQLIQRQQLISNERQKNIALTETGRNLSLKSAEITEQAFCSTGLSKRQADDIIRLCKKITQTQSVD